MGSRTLPHPRAVVLAGHVLVEIGFRLAEAVPRVHAAAAAARSLQVGLLLPLGTLVLLVLGQQLVQRLARGRTAVRASTPLLKRGVERWINRGVLRGCLCVEQCASTWSIDRMSSRSCAL